MKTAVFAVDMQKGFTNACPDELPVPGGEKLVEPFMRLVGMTDHLVGSKDAHPPNAIWIASEEHPQFSKIDKKALSKDPIDNWDVDIYWKAHCVVGTKGFELIDGMPEVCDFDFFVYKGVEPNMHPYGACFHDIEGWALSTGVVEWLLYHKIYTVVVAGLATDYCIANTAMQLARNYFDVVVCLEACAGVSEETTKMAIERMKKYHTIPLLPEQEDDRKSLLPIKIMDTVDDVKAYLDGQQPNV